MLKSSLDRRFKLKKKVAVLRGGPKEFLSRSIISCEHLCQVKVFILQYQIPGTIFVVLFPWYLCQFQGKEMGSPVTFGTLTANIGKAFFWKCLLKKQSSCLLGLVAPRLCDTKVEIQQTAWIWRRLVGASKFFRKYLACVLNFGENLFSYETHVVSYKVLFLYMSSAWLLWRLSGCHQLCLCRWSNSSEKGLSFHMCWWTTSYNWGQILAVTSRSSHNAIECW